MSLKAILYDKNREVFDLLGDIFDVTGHMLMVAPDEESVSKFLSQVRVDVFILPADELEVWRNNMLSEGRIVVPFFICDTQGQMDFLISLGFSELNTVVKPFNPLELLNKLVMLEKLEVERDLNLYGIVNIAISASRKGKSFNLVLKDGEWKCEACIEKGMLKAMSCGIEILKEKLAERSLYIEVAPFAQIKDPVEEFKSTQEFLQMLLGEVQPAGVATSVEVGASEGEGEVLDRVQTVSFGDSLHLLSVFDERKLTKRNYYLRVFEGKESSLNFLINAGGADSWEEIKRFLEEVIGGVGALSAVVVLSPDVRTLFNVSKLYQENPRLYVITSSYVSDIFARMGMAGLRVKVVDNSAFSMMNLMTGHRLRFVPVHHTPYPGGLALFDEELSCVFTPELGSSFSANIRDEDVQKLAALYHRVYMPSSLVVSKALAELRELSFKEVYPMYGHAPSNLQLLTEISGNGLGHDLSLPDSDTLKGILQDILDSLETEQREKFEEYVEAFVYIKEGKVEEVLVQSESLVGMIVGQVVSSDMKPYSKLKVLEKFALHNVFIPPF